jgi:hypothetical protein
MKRLPILCLVVAGILYSASAFASVCFLADTACQQGQYQVDDRLPCLDQNSKWIHEGKRCMGLVYGGVVCNDSTGNYFEEGSCPAGYVDFSTVDQDKYECGNSLLCDRCCNNVRCKSKFKKCENNSVPASTNPDDICQEPKPDNTIKYTKCVCPKPDYEQTCVGKGVTTSGNYCIDSDGKTFWSACQCESGYFETSYSNIKCPSNCTYGCLNLGTYTPLPGTSNYCWSGAECAPEPCKTGYSTTQPTCSEAIGYKLSTSGYSGDSPCYACVDLPCDSGYSTSVEESDCGAGETYSTSGYSGGIPCGMCSDAACPTGYSTDISSCEDGYKLVTNGSSGTKPCRKCEVKVCPTGYSTLYASAADCKTDNAYESWTLETNGLSGPDKCGKCICSGLCKDTYTGSIPMYASATTETCTACGVTKTIRTGYKCPDGTKVNAAGSECVCTGAGYPIKAQCEGIYRFSLCKNPDGGCYAPYDCKDGAARFVSNCGTSGDKGWTLGDSDNYGCSKCVKNTCPTGYSTETTSCEDGYKLSTSSTSGYAGDSPCYKCVAKTCEDYGYRSTSQQTSAGELFKTTERVQCGDVSRPCYVAGTACHLENGTYYSAMYNSCAIWCRGLAGYDSTNWKMEGIVSVTSGEYSGYCAVITYVLKSNANCCCQAGESVSC